MSPADSISSNSPGLGLIDGIAQYEIKLPPPFGGDMTAITLGYQISSTRVIYNQLREVKFPSASMQLSVI